MHNEKENATSENSDFKNLSTKDLASKLGVSVSWGLSDSEADNRKSKYGCNELAEEKVNPLLKFLTNFWGPIHWMVEAAVIFSVIALPSFILLGAVIGTQTLAASVTTYGLLMPPIGWTWAGIVWVCLVWFLIQDRLKLLGYRIFNPEHSGILTRKQ